MNYTHHLRCSCTKAAAGDPTGVGSMMTGKLVGDIRLYSEKGELLVHGKLAKPIKLSDDIETSFIVRFDV